MAMIGWRSIGGAAVLAFAAYAAAQDGGPPAGPPQFMTGAVPIDDASYEGLPKQQQFRAFLPRRIDLSTRFPRPGYQGQQPNCVVWATTYAAHSFLASGRDGRAPADAAGEMSPAYVYNRLRDPGTPCNKGVRIVDALNLLQREGTVSFADFPDDVATCATPAPAALLSKAAVNKLSGWRAIAHETAGDAHSPIVLDDIKGALARGEPVVFAMPALPDFMALRDATVYRHATPSRTNWHAMAVVGYDEDRQAFRIINSWGSQWGDKGYAWIDYDTFRLLAPEAYTLQGLVTQATASPPAPVTDPRATLAAELARPGCGAVSAGTVNGRLQIGGFSGDKAALARLRKAAEAVDPKVDWNVALHPWPQCEAEMTLVQSFKAGGVKLAAMTGEGGARTGEPVVLQAGETFGFTASAPSGKPNLSIIYLQADGSAVELYRGTPAGRPVAIGLAGRREASFKVGAPYGDELVIALASDRPLFGATLGDYATERQFLTALRAAIARSPADGVAAAALRIRTVG